MSTILLLQALPRTSLHLALKGRGIHVVKFGDGYHRDELYDDIQQILLTGEEDEEVEFDRKSDEYLAHS